MLISILGIVVLFSFVVIVHELGHFWVAKRVGIRVEKFSLGLGPGFLSRKQGDTVYQIGIIPFGGFVKLAGEDFDEKSAFEAWEYMGKSPGHRAQVLVAGSLQNLVFGLVLLIPVFMIGVPGYDGTRIGAFVPGLPAETSGLQVGDEVLRVNGRACNRLLGWYDVNRAIKKSISEDNSRPVVLDVLRHGRPLRFSVLPAAHVVEKEKGGEETVYLVGISPADITEKYGPGAAVIRAGREFGKMMYGIFDGFRLLLTRQVSAKLLSGPVGIAQWGARVAHAGIATFLYFIAFISVNLGVINLVPFPILDGGHLFGLLVERIRRKRPTRRSLEIVQYVGLAAIVLLFLYVTYNDIMRIAD